MNEALLELYRHSTWATLRLIEYCQGLADESNLEDLGDGAVPLGELAKRIRILGPRGR